MNDYEIAKKKLNEFVEDISLQLQELEVEYLNEQARLGQKLQTIEQQCVNYLRHRASAYDEIIRMLNGSWDQFSTKMERHVLDVERRGCVARIKQRILDEIAAMYPWLKPECVRQKKRDGVEDDPGEFILPFGPFKGTSLREVDTDYLIRLLGQSFVKKSFRSRIERHLAERSALALPLPH